MYMSIENLWSIFHASLDKFQSCPNPIGNFQICEKNLSTHACVKDDVFRADGF